MQLVGIVNITSDSFSDGGQFLDPDIATAHARQLLADGADWLDLGAESSNPNGEPVDAETEFARLAPVLSALVRAGARVAIDTIKPTVMARCLSLGATMINDITALADPAAAEVVAAAQVPVVLMFARNRTPRAEKRPGDADSILAEIEAFFEARIAHLLRCGLSKDQIILDPGMGFFLGSNPEPSLRVLANLDRLRRLGFPLYVSVSRKSFIGQILGGRPPAERGYGTLGAEILAALAGVDYLRTHAIRPLAEALRVIRAIREQPV